MNPVIGLPEMQILALIVLLMMGAAILVNIFRPPTNLGGSL